MANYPVSREVFLLLLSVGPTQALTVSQPRSRADCPGLPDLRTIATVELRWPLGIESSSGCISYNT